MKGRAFLPSDIDPPTNPQGERVTRAKQQFAVSDYQVNADAVAREMLFKLQLASLSRRALVSYSTGRDGQPRVARHHG
jgi:hypothetical protein